LAGIAEVAVIFRVSLAGAEMYRMTLLMYLMGDRLVYGGFPWMDDLGSTLSLNL
jgi:hypothetical protein